MGTMLTPFSATFLATAKPITIDLSLAQNILAAQSGVKTAKTAKPKQVFGPSPDDISALTAMSKNTAYAKLGSGVFEQRVGEGIGFSASRPGNSGDSFQAAADDQTGITGWKPNFEHLTGLANEILFSGIDFQTILPQIRDIESQADLLGVLVTLVSSCEDGNFHNAFQAIKALRESMASTDHRIAETTWRDIQVKCRCDFVSLAMKAARQIALEVANGNLGRRGALLNLMTDMGLPNDYQSNDGIVISFQVIAQRTVERGEEVDDAVLSSFLKNNPYGQRLYGIAHLAEKIDREPRRREILMPLMQFLADALPIDSIIVEIESKSNSGRVKEVARGLFSSFRSSQRSVDDVLTVVSSPWDRLVLAKLVAKEVDTSGYVVNMEKMQKCYQALSQLSSYFADPSRGRYQKHFNKVLEKQGLSLERVGMLLVKAELEDLGSTGQLVYCDATCARVDQIMRDFDLSRMPVREDIVAQFIDKFWNHRSELRSVDGLKMNFKYLNYAEQVAVVKGFARRVDRESPKYSTDYMRIKDIAKLLATEKVFMYQPSIEGGMIRSYTERVMDGSISPEVVIEALHNPYQLLFFAEQMVFTEKKIQARRRQNDYQNMAAMLRAIEQHFITEGEGLFSELFTNMLREHGASASHYENLSGRFAGTSQGAGFGNGQGEGFEDWYQNMSDEMRAEQEAFEQKMRDSFGDAYTSNSGRRGSRREGYQSRTGRASSGRQRSEHREQRQRSQGPRADGPTTQATFSGYLELLGLTKKPENIAELKKAYRTQAMNFHPDYHPEAEKETWQKKFIALGKAYQELASSYGWKV
ncbi:MAG: J domain-containing protein [bacterium]